MLKCWLEPCIDWQGERLIVDDGKYYKVKFGDGTILIGYFEFYKSAFDEEVFYFNVQGIPKIDIKENKWLGLDSPIESIEEM